MSKACKYCKWYKRWATKLRMVGWCVRYPEWYHPENAENHFCGEFKERDGE